MLAGKLSWLTPAAFSGQTPFRFIPKLVSFIVKPVSFIVKRVSFVVKPISFIVKRVSFIVKPVNFIVKRVSFAVNRVRFTPKPFPLSERKEKPKGVRFLHSPVLNCGLWCFALTINTSVLEA